jgi:hypothetical protein
VTNKEKLIAIKDFVKKLRGNAEVKDKDRFIGYVSALDYVENYINSLEEEEEE